MRIARNRQSWLNDSRADFGSALIDLVFDFCSNLGRRKLSAGRVCLPTRSLFHLSVRSSRINVFCSLASACAYSVSPGFVLSFLSLLASFLCVLAVTNLTAKFAKLERSAGQHSTGCQSALGVSPLFPTWRLSTCARLRAGSNGAGRSRVEQLIHARANSHDCFYDARARRATGARRRLPFVSAGRPLIGIEGRCSSWPSLCCCC